MASTGKCPFCGATVTSDQKNCPDCGGANPHYVADSAQRIMHPKTIEELKEYCAERGMPLLRMRFFIGEDYREPKAFGIFKQGNDFVVYKNKADGSRAVRYRGPDENFAVNELFEKLLEECHLRGIYPDGKPETGTLRSNDGSGASGIAGHKKKRAVIWISIAVCIILFNFGVNYKPEKRTGYYLHDNKLYYYEDRSYGSERRDCYVFDDGWKTSYDISSNKPIDLSFRYLGKDYQDEWGGYELRFPETGYYFVNNRLCYFCEQSENSHRYDCYVFDEGWRESNDLNVSKPIPKDSSITYLGNDYQGEWGGYEISFPEPFRAGYYVYNRLSVDELYYTNGDLWYKYSEEKWKEIDYSKNQFPYHTAWRIIIPDKYYQENWDGPEFDVEEGYYRHDGKTYYCVPGRLGTHTWYIYDDDKNGWKIGEFPAVNYSQFFCGTDFQPEWSGVEINFSNHPNEGYYLYDDRKYFYDSSSGWYEYSTTYDTYHYYGSILGWRKEPSHLPQSARSNNPSDVRFEFKTTWKRENFPLTDQNGYIIIAEDFYQGADFQAKWGVAAYTKDGYYSYGGTKYYVKNNTWYQYSKNRWIESEGLSIGSNDDYFLGSSVPVGWGTGEFHEPSSQSSDSWSDNDYDSWDMDDTNWDSDW